MGDKTAIAIDGPAGAGKSTIAKLIAKRKGYIYVDTGAMYRAMALYFIEQGIGADEQERISEAVPNVDVTITYENREQIVWLNGRNVNSLIRTEEVGKMASSSSANREVRSKLVELQQALARKESVVMDGRDIGTCVLPGAQLKIFLTASVEARAKRRYDELCGKGEKPDINEITEDIRERDYRDMNRDVSPLRAADDAVFVDSSHMGIEEVIKTVADLFHEKCQQIG